MKDWTVIRAQDVAHEARKAAEELRTADGRLEACRRILAWLEQEVEYLREENPTIGSPIVLENVLAEHRATPLPELASLVEVRVQELRGDIERTSRGELGNLALWATWFTDLASQAAEVLYLWGGRRQFIG